MCADRQRNASASVLLSSVYFEKEVEKPRLANGYGGLEKRRDGGGRRKKEWSVEEEAEAGGGTKETWEVLEEREGAIGEKKRG